MNGVWLLVPLALLTGLFTWLAQGSMRTTVIPMDLDLELERGLGLIGTLVLVSLVALLTLYLLYLITP